MTNRLGKPKIESISHIFFGEISSASSTPLKEAQIKKKKKIHGNGLYIFGVKKRDKSRKHKTLLWLYYNQIFSLEGTQDIQKSDDKLGGNICNS